MGYSEKIFIRNIHQKKMSTENFIKAETNNCDSKTQYLLSLSRNKHVGSYLRSFANIKVVEDCFGDLSKFKQVLQHLMRTFNVWKALVVQQHYDREDSCQEGGALYGYCI